MRALLAALAVAAATPNGPAAPAPPPAAPPASPPAPAAGAAAHEALTPVPLVGATALLAGDSVAVALGRDGESLVAPEASFRVDVAAAVAEARLALYDAQDVLVAGAEQAEVGTGSTRLLFTPARPLRPGSRYTLRLEGAATRELVTLGGQRHRGHAFAIRTSGEPPADPAPGAGKRKRRKG